MRISTFIQSAMVAHLNWLKLSINNEKLINLEDQGLLSLPVWISVVLIEWIFNFRNFFFLSIMLSIFIKSVAVSHLKWLNLLINNKKLIDLADPGLLLLPAWISVTLIKWFCLISVLFWSLYSYLVLWLLLSLHFCLIHYSFYIIRHLWFVSHLICYGLPLLLRLLFLRTFKQSLSDDPRSYVLISLIKPFCPFSAFGAYNPDNKNSLYNLTNNNEYKCNYDIVFINSRLLANNHNLKEVNLSFTGCKYIATVKLNWSWQLDFLDPKPIYIIKAILLVVTLFWDLTFAPCPYYIMKLAFKLSF